MLRILVVDDERWIRIATVKLLSEAAIGQPIQVLQADSVASAIEVYEQERPDIIISDVCFPVSDGCTLCATIYAQNANVKFLMISGYDEFEFVKKSLQYRAVDYLLKPVSATALNMAVRRCVQELHGGYIAAIEPDVAPSIQEVIEAIKASVRNNCAEKYSLSDFALQWHLNESYLSNAFSKATGQSLTSYVNDVKMKKARQLIRTTSFKMVEIAAMVGYDNQHYFARVFKKVCGESPTEYKQRVCEANGEGEA